MPRHTRHRYRHPDFSQRSRLIDDARQIQVQTNGFELLDKVKWVQRRNAQLVAELERLTREPIITPDLLNIAEENQPEREERKVRGYTDDGSGQTYGREENRTERKKRPIWWWMGQPRLLGPCILVGDILTFLRPSRLGRKTTSIGLQAHWANTNGRE